MSRDARTVQVEVGRVRGDDADVGLDVLAVEAPLAIRVHAAGLLAPRTVSITMCTPGDDAELAVGYLVGEGLVRARSDVIDATCDDDAVAVTLATTPDLAWLDRGSVTTSACGVCGKTSLDTLRATPTWPIEGRAGRLEASLVHRLPNALREAQAVFACTGGLHAAALFELDGTLRCVREDVGRHNAVDKVIGAQLLDDRLPARDTILLVSGRASFELVQKAVMAGIPTLAAIGAPSSLAVSLAQESGLTLLGFVRDDRFNIYGAVP